MKPGTVFPQSKIKEIALTDPDVKDISKPAIEVLKNAAEIFAAQFFQKCFEEAHKGKRITSKISDFVAVVNKDEVFHQMLSQFIVNQKDIEKEENEEDKDIENAADVIGSSEHNSNDNSDNETEKNGENENEEESNPGIDIDKIIKMNQESSDNEYNDDEDNFKDDEAKELSNAEEEENKDESNDQDESKDDGAALSKNHSSSSPSTESDLSGESDEDMNLDVDDD